MLVHQPTRAAVPNGGFLKQPPDARSAQDAPWSRSPNISIIEISKKSFIRSLYQNAHGAIESSIDELVVMADTEFINKSAG